MAYIWENTQLTKAEIENKLKAQEKMLKDIRTKWDKLSTNPSWFIKYYLSVILGVQFAFQLVHRLMDGEGLAGLGLFTGVVGLMMVVEASLFESPMIDNQKKHLLQEAKGHRRRINKLKWLLKGHE